MSGHVHTALDVGGHTYLLAASWDPLETLRADTEVGKA